MTGSGLRERKRQQARDSITAAALDLFTERGFEQVTVREIAARADVSEATVFNHFPAKEDLVYSRLAAFEAGLVSAVRDRAPDQTLLDAFRGYLLGQRGLLGTSDPQASAALRSISRVIADSPALQARERQVYDDATRALAEVIADAHGSRSGDIRPWVLANALTGVHRALVHQVRGDILAGTDARTVRLRARRQADRALALLEQGLAGG